MPIVDYNKVAEKAEEWFFKQDISQKNKDYISEFLNAYDVSPARKAIFLKHVAILLKEIPDIKKLFDDRSTTNKIFSKFRQKYKVSYYATIKNVSIRFVTWLNEGEKPKGFIDVKNDSKDKQKRHLKPSDMVTWEDGKKIIEQTNSIQLKAVFMCQLDAGLRPSELIDLNRSSVEVDGDLIILHVKGKTGSRAVVCHRCVPYLLRWMKAQPVKDKNAPLWMVEYANTGAGKRLNMPVRRYNYRNLQKRFDLMRTKAGVKKPVDCYNLRHSSCAMDKLDNVPTELAADRHGHSVEFFTKTYARLSVKDVADRYRQHYGMSTEETKESLKNIVCHRCDEVNEPESEYCAGCGVVLDLKVAMGVHEEFKEMKKAFSMLTPEVLQNLQSLSKQVDRLTIEKEIEAKTES